MRRSLPCGFVALGIALWLGSAALRQPVTRCDKRATELRGPLDSGEGRRRLEQALHVLEAYGTPFVVRNSTRAPARMRGLSRSLSGRCGATPNDMARQIHVVQEEILRSDPWTRAALDGFLALRCWCVGGRACSIDSLFTAFPDTLQTYVRTPVVPFGTFGGDRLLQWLLGDVGVAVLFDWTFMLSAHHSKELLGGEGATEPGCSSPAAMLQVTSAVDGLVLSNETARSSPQDGGPQGVESGLRPGAAHALLTGATDLFITAAASHHNLVHRHHTWCDGMVSAAWQLEGCAPEIRGDIGEIYGEG